MNVDDETRPYFRFTGRARLEKAVNSLLGLIEGVAIDGRINDAEIQFLELWLAEHAVFRARHPFNELVPVVEEALADRVLTEDEREDIAWLCNKLRSADFFDSVSADLQRLHGVLGGIVADASISVEELRGLQDWLDEHEHLRMCWPYDEVGSLIAQVMRDGRIDDEEHSMLMRYFADFVAIGDGRALTQAALNEVGAIQGLCAVNPAIEFSGRGFCVTGKSARVTRDELHARISERGGITYGNVSKKTDYLVIGADGNPCWSYACYGRKVEKAIELRRAGARLAIVHEIDLHDALVD